MKVLLTHEAFPPDIRGGGELYVYEIAKGLRDRGVDVRVLTTGDPAIESFDGIPTTRLPISRYRFNLEWNRIRREADGCDLIQTFNYHACVPSLMAGRSAGKPVVCAVLGLFREAWREMKPLGLGAAWQAWERYQLRLDFDRVIFPSEYSRDEGVRMGIDPDKTGVCCPGVDHEKFQPDAEKDDVIVFNGKFEARKGVFEVLQVARAMPEARFEMFGWGPTEAALRQQAPPNVEIIPHSDHRLRRALARARIFLLPSKAETFGLAMVQAMAAGCAVVSSIPLEFAGVRVNPADSRAQIEAVRQLWNDRDLTAQMGRTNVTLARQYSWHRLGDELLAIYDDVLRTRSRR